MHKAAQIYDLDLRLTVPFRVAIDVFGDKDHVALAYLEPFAEIYVRSATLYNDSEPCFPSVAVSSTKMIFVKNVL
jgi:hypothetical protein